MSSHTPRKCKSWVQVRPICRPAKVPLEEGYLEFITATAYDGASVLLVRLDVKDSGYATYVVRYYYGEYAKKPHEFDHSAEFDFDSLEAFREHVHDLHIKTLLMVPVPVVLIRNSLGVTL